MSWRWLVLMTAGVLPDIHHRRAVLYWKNEMSKVRRCFVQEFFKKGHKCSQGMYTVRHCLWVKDVPPCSSSADWNVLCFNVLLTPFKASYDILASTMWCSQFFLHSEGWGRELVRRTDGVPVCLVFLKSTAGEAPSQTTQLHCLWWSQSFHTGLSIQIH